MFKFFVTKCVVMIMRVRVIKPNLLVVYGSYEYLESNPKDALIFMNRLREMGIRVLHLDLRSSKDWDIEIDVGELNGSELAEKICYGLHTQFS